MSKRIDLYGRAVMEICLSVDRLRSVIGEFDDAHEDPRVNDLKMVFLAVTSAITRNEIGQLAQACGRYESALADLECQN